MVPRGAVPKVSAGRRLWATGGGGGCGALLAKPPLEGGDEARCADHRWGSFCKEIGEGLAVRQARCI